MSTSRQTAMVNGQRGYVISDHALRNAIRTRLGDIAKQIDVQVERGDIYLKGVVGSAYQGQYVIRAIQQMAGVGDVRGNFHTQSHVAAAKSAFDRKALPGRAITVVATTLLAAFGAWTCWPVHHAESLQLVAAQVSVRIENQPAEGVFLTLHPLQTFRDAAGHDLSELRPSGVVQRDGLVEWTTWRHGDGVPAGQYVVTAIWHRPIHADGETMPGPNRLPEHFGDPRKSPLRLLIDSATNGEVRQLLTIRPRQTAASLNL